SECRRPRSTIPHPKTPAIPHIPANSTSSYRDRFLSHHPKSPAISHIPPNFACLHFRETSSAPPASSRNPRGTASVPRNRNFSPVLRQSTFASSCLTHLVFTLQPTTLLVTHVLRLPDPSIVRLPFTTHPTLPLFS